MNPELTVTHSPGHSFTHSFHKCLLSTLSAILFSGIRETVVTGIIKLPSYIELTFLPVNTYTADENKNLALPFICICIISSSC